MPMPSTGHISSGISSYSATSISASTSTALYSYTSIRLTGPIDVATLVVTMCVTEGVLLFLLGFVCPPGGFITWVFPFGYCSLLVLYVVFVFVAVVAGVLQTVWCRGVIYVSAFLFRTRGPFLFSALFLLFYLFWWIYSFAMWHLQWSRWVFCLNFIGVLLLLLVLLSHPWQGPKWFE